jgi:hypothetical protein
LSLEDGGVRSIIQLEILRLIEKELLGKVPIRSLFDLIAGRGAAGIIALALSSQKWSLEECIERFVNILSDSFDSSNLRKMRKLPSISWAYSNAKYHSGPLEAALKNTFGTEKTHFGSCSKRNGVVPQPKVAVVTEVTEGSSVVFTNYQRGNTDSCMYTDIFSHIANTDVCSSVI